MLNDRRTWLALLLAAPWLLFAAGCGQSDQVVRYTVAKPPPIDPLATASPRNPHVAGASTAAGDQAADQPPKEPTDRTLGAIVPVGGQGWFFKLTGPKDAVAAKHDEFVAFVKSLRFAPEGKPQWTLPDGWSERPGNAIRYATLSLDGGGKPLEASVTVLPKSIGDEEYALVNVNRWRGQLGLPPTTADQLPGESTQVKLDGATATVVDLVGVASGGAMGRPPFMSGAPNGN